MKAKVAQRTGINFISTAHLIMAALPQLELLKSFLWQMNVQARIEAAKNQASQRPVASSQASWVQGALESKSRALACSFSIAAKVLRAAACLSASRQVPGLRVENGGGGVLDHKNSRASVGGSCFRRRELPTRIMSAQTGVVPRGSYPGDAGQSLGASIQGWMITSLSSMLAAANSSQAV
jgi:hypothetical protein